MRRPARTGRITCLFTALRARKTPAGAFAVGVTSSAVVYVLTYAFVGVAGDFDHFGADIVLDLHLREVRLLERALRRGLRGSAMLSALGPGFTANFLALEAAHG